MRKCLRNRLVNKLSPEALSKVYSSFDIIGNIAIIKTLNEIEDANKIAKQIMNTHKKVKTVFSQTSSVKGDFRTRELTLLAGEGNTITMYREAGCNFLVDVAQCYISPRLSYEHMRIAQLASAGETMINMFAGVGSFSIIMGHKIPDMTVYSIDINPFAYGYMTENIKINQLSDRVHPLLGDSKQILEQKLQGVADRILMPLPEKALEYLPAAVSALKKSGGWIHYYDFQHAKGQEDPVKKTEAKVVEKLTNLGVSFKIVFSRTVRSTGPNWFQTVLDIQINP